MLTPTPQFLLVTAVPVILLAAALALRFVLPQATARLISILIQLGGLAAAVLLLGLGFNQISALTTDAVSGGDGFGGLLYAGSGIGLVILTSLLSRVLRP